jgi:hypothetical protein
MNTIELIQFCVKDPHINKYFGGVMAADQLPMIVYEKPKLYIVNTDKSGESGQHWICIFTSDVPEYFDSLGKYPHQTEFINFLHVNGPSYWINTRRVQDYNTNTCGLFCLFYSYLRCRNYSYDQIMSMFYHNLQLNEYMVKCFYNMTVQ